MGNVVLKIDSATKIRQCLKLKTPRKGLYVVKLGKESIVHYDRIKLCDDSVFLVWLNRMRSYIINTDTVQIRKKANTKNMLSSPESDLINNFHSGSRRLAVSKNCDNYFSPILIFGILNNWRIL